MSEPKVDREGNLIRPECILVDLDGTLADCDHRRGHLEQKDWDTFFRLMGADPVNRWCRYLIQTRSDHVEIVIVTGRPERWRQVTEDWLDTHQITRAALFMRPENDFRKDDVVKEEILKQQILPRWRPFFAIDDRRQVVDMWRRNGIVTLQCAEGEF